MKKACTHAAFALMIPLACCLCAFALDPSLDVNQYAHTAWKVRDGFTKGVLTSLAQTPDGYLWLGTESGLLRFDGVRPTPWQPLNGQELPGTLITNLLVTRDGTLWIGTFTGLASWKNGKFTRFAEFSGRNVQTLLETRDGTMWIGTYADSAGTLCEIHSTVVHCEVLGSGVWALYEDSKGTLWVGLQNGLWRWKPGPAEFFSIPDEPFGISSFAEDDQGHLLFGSHAGIRRLVDGRLEPYPPSGLGYRWQVTRMLRDHDGALWVGTSEHGIIHIHDQGRTDVFSHLDGFSGDYVQRFFEDREGSVWVATLAGLDRFRAYAIPTISTKQGLSTTGVWSALPSNDGSVWIGTANALNQWKNGQVFLFGSRGGRQKSDGKLNGKLPVSLFEDSSGRIWVSTSTGSTGEIGHLQDDRFTPIRGFQGTLVRCMAEVPAGHLWIADQQNGLTQLFEGRVLQHIPWAGLGRDEFAKVMVADPSQHGLWLGFQQSGVAYFNDGAVRVSYSAKNGLGKGTVTDLRFGANGALWAATDGGLSRLKDGHVITLSSKNGLPCDKVIATIEDNDHSTWLYMACGLVRMAQAELAAWIADPSRVVKATFFDSTDGVLSHAAAGGYAPLMSKSPDGRIWFLPWDGVSVLDPHNLHDNKLPPPVHIEKITADDKAVEISNGMHLPTGVRHLDIDYTALSLIVPEKVHFRFKLEGEDKDWRELVNVRHVEYTNLPPKHYKFRVLACNNSGVWNEQGASLDFVIPPAWYQTNWFRALCAATFLALLWVAHQLRLRQLHHQFAMTLEARVGERTRIARDLHDTLLQSFQALLLRFQAGINMLAQRPADARRVLEDAVDRASQAIAEGRDAIGNLRMSTVEKNDLSAAIKTIAEELARAQDNQASTPFQVLVEGTPRELHPILRDEVYRLATEALRNAFRHAAAKNVELEIRYDEKYFRLRIRDDGKGIPSDVLSGREGHYGLPGMRERAKLVGGKLTIWTELDSGTEIELTIPGATAYVKSARPFWYFGKRSATETDEEEIERE